MENYKYTITKDYVEYLHTNHKQLAISAAKGINGAVYISSNGEMTCIYSYKDDLNLKPITLNGDMAQEFNS
mgnify:CR=1 FL=1